MSTWYLYFDGLCEVRNRGGRMAWGWLIRIPGRPDVVGHGTKPPAPANTNNVAEYLALGHGLRAVSELVKDATDFDGLIINGDSKLVVEQINRNWAVNAEHIKPLHARCLELLFELSGKNPWGCEWIPREENTEADELSRQGYFAAEGKMPPERKKKAG